MTSTHFMNHTFTGDVLPPELQQHTNGGEASGGGSFDSQTEGGEGGAGSCGSHSDSPIQPSTATTNTIAMSSPQPHTPPALPPPLLHLFQNSGLITTIASNLSNDSGKLVVSFCTVLHVLASRLFVAIFQY